MRQRFCAATILLISLLIAPSAQAADSCATLNVSTLADDNLTVTMLSMNSVEKTGSYQLTISYKLLNATADKKIDEGAFKIFFTDGTSEPQYGFFGSLFPGDSKERSYTWEYLKSQSVMDVSYNAGFFSSAPSSSKLNWAVPGQSCTLISPAVKAAADKAAAELKAKQEADAKAAADKAAAELKAKQEADAKAAADKAAAELKAFQESEAKAAADFMAKQLAEAKAAATKKSTITCVKGKTIKKVTATKPVCPKGYKKK